MREERLSVEREGASVSWRRLGGSAPPGEPLILINGYAATGSDWDPGFLEALGGFADLICPDNRGVGESAPGGPAHGPLSIGAMAADAIAVLDEIGVERAPVLGWSMGGYVTQQLAALAPERVSAVILLSTDGGGPDAIRAEPANWGALIDHSGTPREQASRLIRLLFPEPPASAIDEEFGDLVAEARAALDPEVLTAQEGAMERWRSESAAARLEAIADAGIPALCAAGAGDVVIPAVNAALLAERLPGAWRASFPGGGHAFMAQEPQRLAGLIRAFLGR